MTKDISVNTGDQERVTQENVQEKFMIYQLMERQVEQLGEHRNMVDNRMVEIETTRNALNEIEGLEKDNEALVPLGSGIYTRVRITTKDVLEELGAGTMQESDINGAKAFLDKRKKELDNAGSQIDEQVAELNRRLAELRPELQRIAAQLQGQQ